MKVIDVNASTCYAVTIGNGILADIGNTVRQMSGVKKVCIVSDSNVWPLYGETVRSNLESVGLSVCNFIFPAGESSKNASIYVEILNFLAENELSRRDCILALGGGVVGDLAGFAAATYLRGIGYIQVPTSLLAMVDSSVGGKTGIDLPGGKNLCGAFWQPRAVFCDVRTLRTLSKDNFLDGCAEVIKYGVLFDPTLFSYLEETGANFDPEAVIARCVERKRDVVAADEFDNGERKLLNLGHTFGHAIEACSHYTISHGKAVSIGIAMAARSAKCPDTARIIALLQQFGLPTTTVFSADTLCESALLDKKRHGNTVDLILPQAIGHCTIVPTPVEHLKTLIEEGI